MGRGYHTEKKKKATLKHIFLKNLQSGCLGNDFALNGHLLQLKCRTLAKVRDRETPPRIVRQNSHYEIRRDGANCDGLRALGRGGVDGCDGLQCPP